MTRSRTTGALATILIVSATLTAAAQQPDKLAKRYGFEVNIAQYPQKTPKESLESVIQAVQNKRIDYLLAHLADPEFVDKRVTEYSKGLQGSEDAKIFLAFDRLVKETSSHFMEDPLLARELRDFARDGEWEGDESKASAKLKSIPTRRVFMKKMQERWFLENRQK